MNPPDDVSNHSEKPARHAEFDAALRNALQSGAPDFDVESHYARLAARLPRHARRARPWRALLQPQWLGPGAFALGAVCAMLLTPTIIPVEPATPVAVEPLGSASHIGAEQRLVQLRLRPDMTVGALQALLSQANAEVVAGPGALGIWQLRVPAEALPQSLHVLRSSRDVLEANEVGP
jgi:hypothetical protein